MITGTSEMLQLSARCLDLLSNAFLDQYMRFCTMPHRQAVPEPSLLAHTIYGSS